jgi:hypothetical protein
MQVVPRRNTPVTAADAKSAVSAAYRSELGHDPNLTLELPLLMSLVWIETARGKSVQNFNLGNISSGESFQGNAWRPPWFEPEDDSARNVQLHQAMLDGKAPKAFRAYDSLDAGATDFMHQLKRSFPEVLEAAADGNPTGFRDALAEKYSKDYLNTPPENFASLAREFGFNGSVSRPKTGLTRVLAALGIAGILAYGAKTLFARGSTGDSLRGTDRT